MYLSNVCELEGKSSNFGPPDVVNCHANDRDKTAVVQKIFLRITTDSPSNHWILHSKTALFYCFIAQTFDAKALDALLTVRGQISRFAGSLVCCWQHSFSDNFTRATLIPLITSRIARQGRAAMGLAAEYSAMAQCTRNAGPSYKQIAGIEPIALPESPSASKIARKCSTSSGPSSVCWLLLSPVVPVCI